MQINLRKASALQSDIHEILRNVEVETVATFEEREVVVDEMTEAIGEWRTNLERKTDLINVLFSIRQKVGAANAESGLNDLLTEHRRVTEQKELLEELTNRLKGKMLTVDQVVTKLAQLEERAANAKDSYFARGRDVEVRTELMDKDDLNDYRSQIRSLKKLQRSINEQVLELNVRTIIDLSEAEVQVLSNEDLV